jgi:hypothetical protein
MAKGSQLKAAAWLVYAVISASMAGGMTPLQAALTAGGQTTQDRPAPPLPLAQTAGAWVVQISRSGSFGPARSTVAIGSTKDVLCDEAVLQCHPETYGNAVDRIESILTREDLTTPWSDKRLLTCMDCPSTTITIYRRQANGAQSVTSYKWTALSRDELPDAVTRLRETLESLASRK